MPAPFCECSEDDCFWALIISHNQYPKTIIGRQKSLHIILLLHGCNYSDFSFSLPLTCSFQLNFLWFKTACTRFTLHLHQLRTSGVACRFTPIRVNVGVQSHSQTYSVLSTTLICLPYSAQLQEVRDDKTKGLEEKA